MCGIVGIWNLDGTPINHGEMDRFTDSLAHRGPDGRGTFFDEDTSLGLGHRRLSILDTTDDAHQPMSYTKNRYWITYNGEIYNFLELKTELKNMGYIFRTGSDTEVILASYDKWGENCQLHFNGMWAFAIWDRKEKKLIISRDRFGVKPLFYYFDGKCFAFASEMKAFLALEWFDAEFDPQMIATALTNASIVEGMERSLIKNIKKLLGGHCLILKKDLVPQIHRWWNTLDHLEIVPQSYEDQVAKFRELFLDACRIRMRSDVPLGTSLSGGLDSSSVLCGMKYVRDCNKDGERLATDWQKAFIATYPGTRQDERNFADQVIQHTGAIPVYCKITPDKIKEDFEKIIFHYEEISDVHIGPWIVYQTQRENNVVVTIDGHGGDELLGGYPYYVISLLIEALFPLPRLHNASKLIKNFQNLYPENERNFILWKILWSKIITKLNHNPWLLVDPYSFSSPSYNEDRSLLVPQDLLFKELYDSFHYFHLPINLRDYDRLSMAHGVEVRSPFLDWRVVCYTFSLPSSCKIGNGFTKRILRDAMLGILPESIKSRTIKLGFTNPDGDWIYQKYAGFISDTIASDEFQKCHIWDAKQISRDLESALRKQDYDTINKAWRYVQVMLLMRTFKDQRDLYFPPDFSQ